jgi:2-polyprenyl-3-methyl-5-hydroxy-6-metoxy-1,4-benzoquinol methylase
MKNHFRRVRKIINSKILKKWGGASTIKAIWDEEFASGQWEFLEDTSRDVIYQYLEKYVNNGTLLDLGCGSGNTGNELDVSKYSRYTGVDISEVAIQKALVRTNKNGRQEKNQYFRDDISSFSPKMRYDVILFRESLFYIPQSRIKSVLDRYSGFLTGGVFIVRIFDRSKYKQILQLIESNYQILQVAPAGGGDIILVFR